MFFCMNYDLCTLYAVANVSLTEELYEVDEDDGNVTVCAELLEGILERPVTVYFSTEDLTAVGELVEEGVKT